MVECRSVVFVILYDSSRINQDEGYHDFYQGSTPSGIGTVFVPGKSMPVTPYDNLPLGYTVPRRARERLSVAYIQQKIIRCPRGHYFDAVKYGSCPLCNNNAGAAASSTVGTVHHVPVTTVLEPGSEVTTVLEAGSADVTTVLESGSEVTTVLEAGSVDVTTLLEEGAACVTTLFESDESVTTILDEGVEATTILESTEGAGNAMGLSHTPPSSTGAQRPKPQRNRDALGMWSSMDSRQPNTSLPMGGSVAGSTGSHQANRQAAAAKRGMTVGVDAISIEGLVAPVVGWVVAISGPSRGMDFRIHAAHNFIGREMGDICLSGDMAISAEHDACITFVPQTRSFYLSHERGRNMLLVNDEPVIGGATKLTSFDVITIGNSKLVFVAFCGPEFDWDTEAQSKA